MIADRHHIPEKECPKCGGHQWYCALTQVKLKDFDIKNPVESDIKPSSAGYKLKKVPIECAICAEGGGSISGINEKNYERILGKADPIVGRGPQGF